MSNTFEEFKHSPLSDFGIPYGEDAWEQMINNLAKAAFYAGREGMRKQVLGMIEDSRVRNPALQDLYQELEKLDGEEKV